MDKTRKQCDSIELLDAKLSAPEQIVPLAEYKKLQELVTSQGIRLMEYESQPEPEPVAWTVGGLITDFSRDFSAYKTKTYTQPLYTTPPQRKPEPKPVAWMLTELDGTPLIDCGDLVVKPRPVLVGNKTDCIPLYTNPPQREWVGLTDEEKKAIYEKADAENWHDQPLLEAVEAKLKEKNGG
jgi:hypothetical protein